MGVLRPWAAGVAWPLTLRPAAQEGTPLGLRRLQADLASIPWTLRGAGESSPWSTVSWGHPGHIRLPFAITGGEAAVRTRLGPRPVAIGGFRPAQEGSVKMGAAPTSRSLSVLKARPRVRSAHWGESTPAPESAAFAARRTPRAGATNPREIRAERGTSGSSQPQNVRSWLSS